MFCGWLPQILLLYHNISMGKINGPLFHAPRQTALQWQVFKYKKMLDYTFVVILWRVLKPFSHCL